VCYILIFATAETGVFISAQMHRCRKQRSARWCQWRCVTTSTSLAGNLP